MKKLFSILLITFISVSVFSQSSTVEDADKLFKKRAYLEAAALYKASAIESKSVLQNLGDCHYFNNQMNEASDVYEKLFNKYKASEIDPTYLFRYSQALKGIKDYSRYDKLLMKNAGATESIKSILEKIDEELKFEFKVQKLNYNLTGSNFGINYFGDKVIFASSSNQDRPKYMWNDKPYLDLMTATISDDKLSDIQFLPNEINTNTHESSAVLSKDGKTMYFSRTGKKKIKLGDLKVINIKIFSAQLVDGKWTNVNPLSFTSDYYSTLHPSLNADNTKMYFSSDMPGSIGSFDIYEVDIKSDGSFGNPKNLGPAINTEEREQFPYISDKNVLYFSSAGFIGFGGLDVFSSKLKDNEFQEPVNLGETINSGLDDFSIIINEDTNRGYFSSDRTGNDVMYSIVRLEKNLENVIVKGDVKNLSNGNFLSGTMVSILDMEGNVITSQVVGANGQFRFSVPKDTKYMLKAEFKQFNIQERPISTDSSFDGKPFNILLEPVNNVKFKSEYFARGTVKSLTTGEPLLGTLISLYDEKGILLDSKAVDERGRYTFDLEPNKKYSITAIKDNFDVFEKKFYTNDTDHKNISYDVLMVPSSGLKSEEDSEFSISNILFDFDRTNITAESSVILDQIVSYMTTNDKVSLEIAGHTDVYGYNEYNIRLSQRRATSAANYIIKKGIDRNRINTSYFGEKLPLNGCIKEYVCTPEEYHINRRCEFRMIE